MHAVRNMWDHVQTVAVLDGREKKTVLRNMIIIIISIGYIYCTVDRPLDHSVERAAEKNVIFLLIFFLLTFSYNRSVCNSRHARTVRPPASPDVPTLSHSSTFALATCLSFFSTNAAAAEVGKARKRVYTVHDLLTSMLLLQPSVDCLAI